MSRYAIEEILSRAMEDENFRLRLLREPAETLSGYALTAQVRQALIDGDLRQVLRALGPNEGETETGG